MDSTKEWWMEEIAKITQRAEAAESALAERDAELARMDVSLSRARRAWQESEEAAKLWQRIALAERDKPCVWNHIDVGWYKSACGSDYFEVIGGFCSGCGHRIEVQP